MSFKDKILLLLLTIITLGIYPFLIFRKRQRPTTTKLSTSSKITLSISQLKSALGGDDNIAGNEYSHTKIKIFFKDRTLIDLAKIQKLKGVSGVVVSSKNITIIVGNQAKELAQNLL